MKKLENYLLARLALVVVMNMPQSAFGHIVYFTKLADGATALYSVDDQRKNIEKIQGSDGCFYSKAVPGSNNLVALCSPNGLEYKFGYPAGKLTILSNGTRRLLAGDWDTWLVSISPNGKRIAFLSDAENDNGELYVVDLEDAVKAPKRMTRDKGWPRDPGVWKSSDELYFNIFVDDRLEVFKKDFGTDHLSQVTSSKPGVKERLFVLVRGK